MTIGPWVWKFYQPISLNSLSDDPANWGVFGDYIGGTLATILAALSFGGLMYSVIQQGQAMRKEWTLRDDESYTKQAVICLSRAYETIAYEKFFRPKMVRQDWIDCARLLLAAKELGNKVKSEGFKAMYNSERAHWRKKFYDLFNPDESFPQSNDPKFFEDGKYDPNSVYEIYSFIKWQEEEPDALSQFDHSDWDISRIAFFFPDQGAKAFLLAIKNRRTAE
ncbi:hypothetical protein D9M70_533480 [compost metagenome]